MPTENNSEVNQNTVVSSNRDSNIDQRWQHKWGFADTQLRINADRSMILTGDRYSLSGYKMPNLLDHIEQSLDISLDPSDCLQPAPYENLPAPNLNLDFYDAIARSFPKSQYSLEGSDRLVHSHGQAAVDEVYKALYDKLDRVVDLVFYCETITDAQNLVELATQHNVCLVPFGGGTSVSCALQMPQAETRMIVAVNLQRLNQIEWIDSENRRACVQAGITGQQLEAQLAEAGFLCGHEPDSIEFSTVGGWIATNSSGMKKNRYGNIEQIVESITLLTPQGIVEQSPVSRVSTGMQIQPLLFGQEGNLGLILKAVIKIHPLPAVKRYDSLIFPNFERGIQFLHELSLSRYLPASIRLVDNRQFRFGHALKPAPQGWQQYLDRLKKFYILTLRSFDPLQMVAATLVMEGSKAEVEAQRTQIQRLAQRYQGLATGAEPGRRGYMLTYGLAYLRDFLTAHQIMGETFETSVPWSQILPVCRAVEHQLQTQHHQFNLPGKPYLSYRISQTYHTGVCLYFMFGVYLRGVAQPESVCGKIEHALREAILANGGSISHHHGVGKIRKDFLKEAMNPTNLQLLKQLKHASDPQNIFGIRNNIFAED